MPLVAFDLEQPGRIAHELGVASKDLSRSPEVPAAVRGLVEDLVDQIGDLGVEPSPSLDPMFWTSVLSTALGASRALQEDDEREQRRRLRVSLEQLRFLFARLAEGQPVSDDRDPREVARWLTNTLRVPQRQLAEVVGVGDRTFQRWVSESATTSPDDEDAHRLALVARLANQLRHSYTGPGVVAWLQRPQPQLGDRVPTELLDDPEQQPALLQAAMASRMSIAT